MTSQSLKTWKEDRLFRLEEFDSQFATSNFSPTLLDETLRAYVMLLIAHFQGFCRDLYTECTQRFASSIPAKIGMVMQVQCESNRRLESTNPTYRTIENDFDRFGIRLANALVPDPATRSANDRRKTHIEQMVTWRNYCAHYNPSAPAQHGSFDLVSVREWKDSCDGFAVELDRIMGEHLQSQLGDSPW